MENQGQQEEDQPKPAAMDPRLAKMQKMHSSFVTEDALQETAAPRPRKKYEMTDEELAALEEEGDFPDDEGEYIADSGQYIDQENIEAEEGEEEFEPEPEPEPEPEDDDVRMARLRTLNKNLADEEALFEVDPEVGTEGETRLCVKCGEANPAGARACSHCHAVMPKMAAMRGEQTFEGAIEETLLDEFKDIIQSYFDEEMSPDELYDYLWTKSDELKAKSEDMLTFSIESGDAERYPELHRLLVQGVEDFEGGLDDLIISLEQGAEDEFEANLKRIEEGESKILKYMGKNDAIIQELKEELQLMG